MKPIIPNPKNDLRKIHDVLVEISKDVSEIKSALLVKSHIESPYWDPDNTSTSSAIYWAVKSQPVPPLPTVV